VDDSTKQALLSRFSDWLDAAEDGPVPPQEPAPTTDLYSLFVEMAGLRSEVRTESRMVKEALDQFRGVFDTLRASQATVQQELERTRAEARDLARATMRPLLLDVIDIRDRLLAALKFPGPPRMGWLDRLLRRNASDGEVWQQGLRLTLQRLDQVLLARRVVALRLEGQPFDPRHARVVATLTDGAAPDGTVIEEALTGFLWDDQVLRTAEVIVSRADISKADISRADISKADISRADLSKVDISKADTRIGETP
jgi:molecular chaperone GrpE